jgi:hypothetical protein
MASWPLRGGALFAVALILGGCENILRKESQPTPPPIKPPTAYVQPSEVEVLSETSRRIRRPRGTVWKRFMLGMSRTDFYIDHVDEAAGEMTVHYSGDPAAYVDCGKVIVNTKTEQGETTIDFPAASAFKQYQMLNRGKVYQVERRMALEASVKVTMRSRDQALTLVDAHSTYSVTRNQSAVSAGGKPLMLNDTISFNGGESGVFPNAATKCQATGTLERQILGLFK